MSIKKIPCGGFMYDDETVEFTNGVMRAKGASKEVTNAIETHGMGWTSEEEKAGFDIQWDGNTEGLESLWDGALFKVDSNLHGITSAEDLIGSTIFAIGYGHEIHQDVTEEYVRVEVDGLLELAGGMVMVALSDITVPIGDEEDIRVSKGIWFLGGEEGDHIFRLYKETSTQEVVHQIDQKYIPQSSGGAMVVNLTFVDFNTPIRADKTLLELGEAFSNGIPVIAKLYLENQLLISAQCVECEDPYGACYMAFGSSTYHSESDSTKFAITGIRTLDDDEETRIDFWECTILA